MFLIYILNLKMPAFIQTIKRPHLLFIFSFNPGFDFGSVIL